MISFASIRHSIGIIAVASDQQRFHLDARVRNTAYPLGPTIINAEQRLMPVNIPLGH